MANYFTPGVYIEEKNAFPNAAVAVETAVPVFIGYTQKAERKGTGKLYSLIICTVQVKQTFTCTFLISA